MFDLLPRVRSDPSSSTLSLRMNSASVISVTRTQRMLDPINDQIMLIDKACSDIAAQQVVMQNGVSSEQASLAFISVYLLISFLVTHHELCVLTEANAEVDTIVFETNCVIRQSLHLMQRLKKEISLQQQQGIADALDQSIFDKARTRFQESIGKYQIATDGFKADQKEDFVRKTRIVNPEISRQQIEEMLESDDIGQYLEVNVMQIAPEKSDDVHQLETEQAMMLKLEDSVKEMSDMFNACTVLVLESGEKLDDIEHKTQTALDRVEKGNKRLNAAEIYVPKTRKINANMYALCIK